MRKTRSLHVLERMMLWRKKCHFTTTKTRLLFLVKWSLSVRLRSWRDFYGGCFSCGASISWRDFLLSPRGRNPRVIPAEKNPGISMGDAVAKWLVRWTPDREVRVRALAGSLCYVVLGPDTLLSQCLSPVRSINGFQQTVRVT